MTRESGRDADRYRWPVLVVGGIVFLVVLAIVLVATNPNIRGRWKYRSSRGW